MSKRRTRGSGAIRQLPSGRWQARLKVDEVTYPEIAKMLGFASAETARQAFVEAQARLLVKLRARGLRPPGETMR